MNDMTHHKPAVRSDSGGVFMDVAVEDAEELQIHLRSLGIGTAALPNETGAAGGRGPRV